MDITTLDIAAALPIAISTPVTNLRQYINSDLGYNDLKFQLLCSEIATVKRFEVAISNVLLFSEQNFTFSNQNALEIATALSIATSTVSTEASRYIQIGR